VNPKDAEAENNLSKPSPYEDELDAANPDSALDDRVKSSPSKPPFSSSSAISSYHCPCVLRSTSLTLLN
jgi:hypothetical protein